MNFVAFTLGPGARIAGIVAVPALACPWWANVNATVCADRNIQDDSNRNRATMAG